MTLTSIIRKILLKVSNPYLVRVGNIKVKVRFANNGVTFEDAFEDLNCNPRFHTQYLG